MDGQLSFAPLDYAGKKKRTKRDVFLAEMAAAVPWSVLEAVIAPHYPKEGPQGGRRAFPIAVMLRIYCLQQWYNLSDPGPIIRPETVMRWHRAGFRSYWRWKSKRRPGRPALALSRRKTAVHPTGIAPRVEDSTLRLGATRRRSRRRGGRLVVARCAMRICSSSNKSSIPVRHARGD